jgi:pimeloyl-ACP methyl ester carboxylesterase
MEIKWNGSTLFYEKTGSGEKSLLLFHGFAQDHSVFKDVVTSLSQEYTCYAFDLFFHGKSNWANGDHPILKQDWKMFLAAFIQQEKINDFSLLGYSIGARFVLTSVDVFPEKIKEIFLVAPDGIKMNFWYSLASYPWITRKLFKSMILHPGRFQLLSSAARQLKLAHPKVLRFAELQMKSSEKRKKVYQTWVVFRRLKYRLEKIAEKMNEHSITVIFILGSFDHLVEKSPIQNFVKILEHARVLRVETGHNRLLELLPAEMLRYLREQSDNRH